MIPDHVRHGGRASPYGTGPGRPGRLPGSEARAHRQRRVNSPDDDWRFLLELVESRGAVGGAQPRLMGGARRAPTLRALQDYVLGRPQPGPATGRGIHAKGTRTALEKAREEAREAIESEDYDEEHGVFTPTFGGKELDASLLLLPKIDFVDYKDERMVRTMDANLDDDGLLKWYCSEEEGPFLACSFWLVECLANQGRIDEAQEAFDRTLSNQQRPRPLFGDVRHEKRRDAGELPARIDPPLAYCRRPRPGRASGAILRALQVNGTAPREVAKESS